MSFNLVREGGYLYYNLADSIFCIDRQNGGLIWSTFVESTNGARNIIISADCVFYGNAYYDEPNPDLFKISKATGQILWKKTFVTKNRSAFTSIGYDQQNGYIYVGLVIEPDTASGNQAQVFCLDQDSQIVWFKKFDWQGIAGPVSIFLVQNEKLLFATGTEFWALNKLNGDSIWKFSDADGWFDSPLIIDNVIYSTNINGNMYCLNTETGSLQWKTFIFGSQSFALSNDSKAIYACNGDLWVLDLNSGKVLLRMTPPGHETDINNIFLSPVGVGDGKIFIVGTRAIYCYTSLGETE
jgi:outer membrane protein assembly factor BamB